MKALAITTLALSVSFSAAEELPKWLASIYPEKLPAGIIVEMSTTDDSDLAEVSNNTGVAISYRGYEPSRPRVYTQTKSEDGWTTPSCHWCATGLRTFTIEPGKSQKFVLPKASGAKRIFTLFFVEDSRQGGLVATATRG